MQRTDFSHRKSLGPFTGGVVMGCEVTLVEVRNLGHQGIVRVRVSQQRADGEEDLGDREGGRPLVLQDIKADGSIRIYIAVVNFRRERHLGRLEWIVGREGNIEEKDAAGVGRVFGTHDGSLPVELILLVGGTSTAVVRRRPA